MLRPTLRPSYRVAQSTSRAFPLPKSRRCLSFAPPSQKSRSWKSSTVRWGLALGGLYYYSTSNAFAEEPAQLKHENSSQEEDDDHSLPTIERLAAERRAQRQPLPSHEDEPHKSDEPSRSNEHTNPETPQEYEEEAEAQGAFNPETGEINWDCPCLGGMAHGPCGEEFKSAFSCFVHSTAEPKGMDCIDKFKGMQDCFRQHPDIYGAELDEDDEEIQEAENQAGTKRESKEVPSESSASGKEDEKSATSSTSQREPSLDETDSSADAGTDRENKSQQLEVDTETKKDKPPPEGVHGAPKEPRRG
ncbi:MAG: hypothetical protein M1825_004507 [Sarcosagium campestre]|nr:MAG: hypothetical protein M1825_004507 [Sarcosagium campestre]